MAAVQNLSQCVLGLNSAVNPLSATFSQTAGSLKKLHCFSKEPPNVYICNLSLFWKDKVKYRFTNNVHFVIELKFK